VSAALDDDPDYAMRVAEARCPEIADQVVSVDTLRMLLEVAEALEDRLADLALQVEGRQAV
jgi:hypothetical protein